MREILFRGKRLGNGEWNYSSMIFLLGENATLMFSERKPVRKVYEKTVDGQYDVVFNFIEVQSNTVGQFTGLKDKNSKMVFEGDIVKVQITQTEDIQTYVDCKYKIGVIVYNNDFALFTCKNNFMNFINWAFNDYEVIGNIHDNPELLEEEK